MIIDSHVHFWHFDPVQKDWITEDMQAIRRDFFPDDIAPILKRNKVDGCILVQVDQREGETEFLLDQASQSSLIKGVVGWIDWSSPNFGDQLAHYKKHKVFKGIRHLIQAEPAGFMLDSKFISNIALLSEHNLTYDVVVYEHQLGEVNRFMDQLPPGMKLVIDHAAKPNIAKQSFDNWSKWMKAISVGFPEVMVKLSGLITEADWENWKISDIEPYVKFCLDHFGPERLMFGSDWPVCLLAGKYDQVIEMTLGFLDGLSKNERESILYKNAQSFYATND